MITIAIVEDEEAYAKQLTEYIEKYQQESGRRFRVIRFTDGDEIVEKYTGEYDIILMDIQMQFMDGMTDKLCDPWLRGGCHGLCAEASDLFFLCKKVRACDQQDPTEDWLAGEGEYTGGSCKAGCRFYLLYRKRRPQSDLSYRKRRPEGESQDAGCGGKVCAAWVFPQQ